MSRGLVKWIALLTVAAIVLTLIVGIGFSILNQ